MMDERKSYQDNVFSYINTKIMSSKKNGVYIVILPINHMFLSIYLSIYIYIYIYSQPQSFQLNDPLSYRNL